ncbi:hypothetical protein DFQ28_004206 [Apophysomyces sp. BC1034]|nr:hypothetical protein DFQ30_004250 [Apophysomyces sp. BC1015]KAG0178499.1 hypothetical protein DFQ29_003407 [Apophysomyces sp. BC1021]KAG0188896.1 hypothetical protein DFQ28_004206 [Apophysomyces sp. BC1034]
MSQQSKEWIKQRMTALKKQAGFAFNQDLFISILLCLASGRDKHLILTAPLHCIAEVAHMASQICRCLFGFTTAHLTCHANQTPSELVQGLFASARDEFDLDYRAHQQMPKSTVDLLRPHDGLIYRQSRSTQTVDSHMSASSSHLSQQTNRKLTPVSFEEDLEESLNHSHTSPVSPVDFTFSLKRRERSFLIPRNTTSSTISKEAMDAQPKKDRSRWSDHDEPLKRTSGMNRLAQSLIIQRLDEASELTQAALLELIITKELRISNVRYNTPKPYFLLIVVLPQDYNCRTIATPLLDRFFVSYNFDEDMVPHPMMRSSGRRAACMKTEEIKLMAEQAARVHINIDISRFIRDIVVGLRTHPLVQGGLTARASQDLVSVTKTLAAIFRRDYLTPDLVSIAAEKVFGHRLHVLAPDRYPDAPGHEERRTATDIVAEILRIVYVPV